ncbi:hypothetical protein NHX12_004674 [Muraenolepis orangiensis]|uniref:Uncharacterized protein n=1 Tax=Muraenolepis orangiensis TaxID=630683 RepID=A0A9Q0DY77_9TELE|nr:hypothetical protein NHX12_004674 [Muraenolepis orangiensis]
MTSRPPVVWVLVMAGVMGCVREGWGFSNGSVAYSCDSLLPGHVPHMASPLTSPYTVTASTATYRPGGRLNEKWPVGCFTNIDTTLINTLHCSGMQCVLRPDVLHLLGEGEQRSPEAGEQLSRPEHRQDSGQNT